MHFSKPPLGTPIDWENPLNRDLVLAYACNEGHGDKVQDLSLNGNHGTLHNFAFPPTVASGWNPGQTGIGVKSDGADDYIGCGNNPNLDMSGDTTLSALICPETLTSAPVFMIKGEYHSGGYYLRSNELGKVSLVTNQGGAHQTTDTSAGDIGADNWYRICAVRVGANVDIYINGEDCTDVHGTHIDPVASGNDLLIGIYTEIGSVYPFDGAIDQPRIMNRAWTAKEVRDYAINPWQVYLDEDD